MSRERDPLLTLGLIVALFFGGIYVLAREIVDAEITIIGVLGFSTFIGTLYFLFYVMLILPSNRRPISYRGLSGHLPNARIPPKAFIVWPGTILTYFLVGLFIRYIYS